MSAEVYTGRAVAPRPSRSARLSTGEAAAKRSLEWCADPAGEGMEKTKMQKLELTWVGKDEPIAVEPRILIEDVERSNRAKDPNTENLLIHGDNLLALVRIDSFGEPIINEAYNPEMLAAAMALHEGFTYEPDAKHFWKQAHSDANGKAWLYTTTKHVSRAYLNAIAADMADGEFLVIACSSFDSAATKAFPNIKVKKIPQMFLKRCEFDKTDYALNSVDGGRGATALPGAGEEE